jgi:hypothetical protein
MTSPLSRGTSLDMGAELDALAKLPKDERKEPKITAVDDARAETTSDFGAAEICN